MIKQVGRFIQKQATSFTGWVKLLFADDDERKLHPAAPTMKNVILFVLLVMFCIAFLKVVYLMEVTVRSDIRSNKTTDSITQVDHSFEIPDIPSNWMTVFLAGLGIMAGLSGAKKIAEYKYSNGKVLHQQPNGGESNDQPQNG